LVKMFWIYFWLIFKIMIFSKLSYNVVHIDFVLWMGGMCGPIFTILDGMVHQNTFPLIDSYPGPPFNLFMVITVLFKPINRA